jgi:hypothetical protein
MLTIGVKKQLKLLGDKRFFKSVHGGAECVDTWKRTA